MRLRGLLQSSLSGGTLCPDKQNAIKTIVRDHPEAFFIFSNGITARHGAVVCEPHQGLFLLHAMGEALPIGIGLASTQPRQKVVLVEGDGNAQMGSAAWLLEYPENLIHYVLVDNQYETTGGQPLPEVAWPQRVRLVRVSPGGLKAPIPPSPSEQLKSIAGLLRVEVD